ncbi:MAG: hypothetical protein ABI887_07825 [Burkholderiales bacterium]
MLLTAMAGAQAQPAPEPLPFIDQTGWIRGALHYSAVVARFGEPPVAVVSSQGINNSTGEVTGGHLVLAYPDLGLSVAVERQHRAAADPIVDSLRLSEPWVRDARVTDSIGQPKRRDGPMPAPRWVVAGTGLHVGMSVRDFDELVARHHRIDTDYRGRDGNGRLTLADTHWRGRRDVSVEIDRGYVGAITFESTDRPLFYGVRRAIGPILMIVLVWAAGALWQRARGHKRDAMEPPDASRRRPSASWAMLGKDIEAVRQGTQHVRLILGVVCLALGAGLAWVSWSAGHGSSDPYSTLGALVVGAAAAGAFLFALVLFSGLRHSGLGTASRGVLIVLLAAAMVGTVVGKFIK